MSAAAHERLVTRTEQPGTEPILQARGLGWSAGAARILESVDLEVRRGELLGVIGPNGAGKTTLLRLLAGIRTPTDGDVRLDGRPLSGMSARERARRIAFMSQESTQPLPFTVMEVLLMGRYPHLRRFEGEGVEDLSRARQTLSYVGLSGFEDRSMAELSGGERQLVLFAKSLMQDTEVLVLDEPSSSLDIGHQDRIFSMTQELARERRAVVASVHNLGVAAEYCSRLLLLEKGTVAADGRPEDVLKPRTLDRVYGVRTLVSPSTATGSLTVTVVPGRTGGRGSRVHLIGGAGSAVNMTRELYRLGYSLSGGIAHEHDSDQKLWKSLGIPCVSVGAFSRITEEEVAAAAPLLEEAEVTVLCSFPVGAGNLGNLSLARRARRLVILQPGPGDLQRSFFSMEGRVLFDEICRGARLLGYRELLDELAGEKPAGREGRRSADSGQTEDFS